MAQNSPDAARLAKRFIDTSLKKGRSRQPSKAAYARALKMARLAIDDLMHVASRAGAAER
jgi:hypothetical protein